VRFGCGSAYGEGVSGTVVLLPSSHSDRCCFGADGRGRRAAVSLKAACKLEEQSHNTS